MWSIQYLFSKILACDIDIAVYHDTLLWIHTQLQPKKLRSGYSSLSRDERKERRPQAEYPLREGILKRNAQTVRHWLAPGIALPSARIAGGTCAPHCNYPPSLVKGALLEPGTEAAFQGRCFTTS